jgi:hypothetical protein
MLQVDVTNEIEDYVRGKLDRTLKMLQVRRKEGRRESTSLVG